MPDQARGYFSELEMAVWALGYDRRSGRYLTFVPYMVVDHGSAMAMGREVYGFPKQLGVVNLPDNEEKAFRVDVDAVRTWGADHEFTRQRLLTIPWVSTQFGEPPVDFSTQEQLVRELARTASSDPGLMRVATGAGDQGDIDHLAGAVELLVSRTLPMVFLKQIRDARQPTKACYQAIHTANFEVTAFRGAGRLRGHPTLLLEDYDNVPICRELGLDGCRQSADGTGPSGTAHELVPIDSFWVDFDFNLTVAEEVWVQPQGPAAAASVSISTGASGVRRGR